MMKQIPEKRIGTMKMVPIQGLKWSFLKFNNYS